MSRKLLCFLAAAGIALSAFGASPRKATIFDSGWKFSLGDVENAWEPSFRDASWRSLDLPHDWSIEGENLENNPGGGSIGYFPTGVGWYRKTFNVPAYGKDKIYTIEFDGVYMNSTVWINGHELGTWPYGYSSFSYDLTPYLKAKGNVIAVRVDNSHQTNSRWYSGSGIYRHVHFVETGPVHFAKWGVFARTESASETRAVLRVDSQIEGKIPSNATVRHRLLNRDGAVVAETVSKADSEIVTSTLEVPDPERWGLDNPYLYTLQTTLLSSGKELDAVETSFGIRTAEYDSDKGFLLNGERVKMKGVNLHHDGGAMGAAVPERVWERRLEILKSGGCNAVRTAHNPPAPEFLDLCDRLGILVMDEAFDQWLVAKNEQDYHLYYNDWHEADLTAMVARDRNHPSVVMWSTGNEIKDQMTETGPALARDLIAICHRLDPTRLVTSGNDEIASNTPATPEFLAAFENDIVGYNYPDRWRTRRGVLYALDKAEFPERRVVATESGGYGGARGQYQVFAATGQGGQNRPAGQQGQGGRNRPAGQQGQGGQNRPAGQPGQGVQGGQGQGAPAQGMNNNRRGRNNGLISSSLLDVEWRWRFNMDYDYVIGDFMWTGIDYYGETRWPSRGSSSGYLDNCGFKKDGYYFFKSIWTDEPVLHLLPHWNWTGHEGEIMQVACFTNCEEVELFVNGKSYGKKSTEFPRRGVDLSWSGYGPDKHFATTLDLHLVWDVVYQPGEIKAVGTRGGEKFEEIIRTTGAPRQLRLSVDRPSFNAVPGDVAHVTVEVLDESGNVVPLAENLIRFSVTGGKLLGVESGNMSDLGSVKASERKAYGGLCLAIVGADKPGTLTVTAESEGLLPAEISFIAK